MSCCAPVQLANTSWSLTPHTMYTIYMWRESGYYICFVAEDNAGDNMLL